MGKLTAAKIRNIDRPGRYGDGNGLALVVTGPGKGYWVLRAVVNGRRRDIGLGAMDLVKLAEARDAAIDLRRDIQRGIERRRGAAGGVKSVHFAFFARAGRAWRYIPWIFT
ncbi:MAG: Arm DNA-binding domain-containing protein [Sphingomonadaceae bacterium]